MFVVKGLNGSTVKHIHLFQPCYNHLLCGQTPPLSLANMMFTGSQPFELSGLWLIEEAIIALSHSVCSIIQICENSTEYFSVSATSGAPNIQKGFHGYIIIFPQ